jgi:hypothetical protein
MSDDSNTLVDRFIANHFGWQPVGSHFKDPILVAAIVVNGFCAISFAMLGIAMWSMDGKTEKGRKVFAVLSGIIGTMFL